MVTALRRFLPRTVAACVLLAGAAGAGDVAREPRLEARPGELTGVPGEPLVVELVAEVATPAQVKLRVPGVPLLVLRATEKQPVEPGADGGLVFRRRLIWQGLEPGAALLDGICLEIAGREYHFPAVRVTIRPAPPGKEGGP
jgi:hypothetical protein